MLLFNCYSLILLFNLFNIIISLSDLNEHCSYWASIGECSANPSYMLNNCQKSCSEIKTENNKFQTPLNFYTIIEEDINGNIINYNQFKNKIIYIVNVASQCGYTNDNYNLLKSLSLLRSNKFEILIFPCNQFGQQESGNSNEISNFAYSKGFNGIIMSKGDVNGPNTRPTFLFLKQATSKKNINW